MGARTCRGDIARCFLLVCPVACVVLVAMFIGITSSIPSVGQSLAPHAPERMLRQDSDRPLDGSLLAQNIRQCQFAIGERDVSNRFSARATSGCKAGEGDYCANVLPVQQMAPRFEFGQHWAITSLGGSGIPLGIPSTITYSFAPDGTFVPNDFGFTGPSNLFATLDGIYGNSSTWQSLIIDVLDRFSELSGVTFVLDPIDDGATVYTFPGAWGSRGDIRFAGVNIDGNGGLLGQAAPPIDGDIVIDTGDSFFNDVSSNSLHLRQVIAHELGHALGLLHVCPMDGTKLMEPELSINFDGPQHDEIRALGHLFGDPFEPNDQIATAADVGLIAIDDWVDVGSISLPAISNGSRLGLRTDGDQDYFRFSVLSASTVTITATPLGLNYADNPQTCGAGMDCCTGGFTDSLTIADLAVALIDTDGVMVMATADAQPPGAAEVIALEVLPTAGEYFVRVYETGAPLDVQSYDLVIEVFDPPVKPLRITLPNGVPDIVPPAATQDIDVRIEPRDEMLIAGSAMLHFRSDGGAFTSIPLIFNGGDSYTATLPGVACGEAPEFFIAATGSINGQVTSPVDGAQNPYAVFVGQDIVHLDDDFENDLGWTVVNDVALTDGAWERGTPDGVGSRGDPPTDFDGSGMCYLTDPPAGNTDVDGGTTWMVSPMFDLTGGETTVSYAVWYTNDAGGAPDEDVFRVQISNDDGQNWTTVQTLGPITTPGWSTNQFSFGGLLTPTAQSRIRFEASDLINPSVVEAGVDAVRVVQRVCIAPPMGDFDGDGDVDLDDFVAFVDCWSGPNASPSPTPPVDANDCLGAFDMDGDNDVDQGDAAGFQRSFNGA